MSTLLTYLLRFCGYLVDSDDLLDDMIHKEIRGLDARVDGRVLEELSAHVHRPVRYVGEKVPHSFFLVALRLETGVTCLHALDGRVGMSGHVKLWNDLDVSRLGMLEDVDVVSGRVEAGAA